MIQANLWKICEEGRSLGGEPVLRCVLDQSPTVTQHAALKVIQIETGWRSSRPLLANEGVDFELAANGAGLCPFWGTAGA
jgi:hypothetical protein